MRDAQKGIIFCYNLNAERYIFLSVPHNLRQGGNMFQKLNKKEFKPSSPKFEDEWFPGRDDDDYDWDD